MLPRNFQQHGFEKDMFYYLKQILLITAGMIFCNKYIFVYDYTGLGSPEGIAIDYVSRNIFFTDSKLDTLEVSRLDGSFRKTLFNTDMVNPRAIVLDPSQG